MATLLTDQRTYTRAIAHDQQVKLDGSGPQTRIRPWSPDVGSYRHSPYRPALNGSAISNSTIKCYDVWIEPCTEEKSYAVGTGPEFD